MQEKLKYVLRILIIILLNVCMILSVGFAAGRGKPGRAVPALSRLGDQGEEVRAVQQRLYELGYYIGEVDGVYGSGTASAVKAYQQDQGLAADGVAGNATLRLLGLSTGDLTTDYADADLRLLARLVDGEAGDAPYSAQVAVAAVALNRLGHPSYPDTIPGVVYQAGAFSSAESGKLRGNPSDSALRAAKEALHGADPSGGALYFRRGGDPEGAIVTIGMPPNYPDPGEPYCFYSQRS